MDHPDGVDEEVEMVEDLEMDDESDDMNSNSEAGEPEDFDITLAATHSYMGTEMEHVSSGEVVEAGWQGSLPCLLHHSCVFPGETVPLLAIHQRNISVFAEITKKDNLFGLLSPDPDGEQLSGLGVVCSMFAVDGAGGAAGVGAGVHMVAYKARALQRCRIIGHRPSILHFNDNIVRPLPLEVLPELATADALRPHAFGRTDSADVSNWNRRGRLAAASETPWPLFVFDQFHMRRMRNTIVDHFADIGLDKVTPAHANADPTAFSFWAAHNLPLSPAERLVLFATDDALARLHITCKLIKGKWSVCCRRCAALLARRRDTFLMSSDGVHNTYANPGGYMHEIVTVSQAEGVTAVGAASSEYSWFPGYSWTVLVCSACRHHAGWKFEALPRRRALRPALFYGLHRHYVQHDKDSRADVEM